MQRIKEYGILLVLIGFFAYFPSLFGNFIWDDEDFVYANEYVKTFRIDKFFTENAIAGRGKLSNYYRPLQFSLYALVYKIAGPSPFMFHFVSVLLHTVAAVLVFLLLNKILKYDLVAFCSSLFFLLHPIQTESVSYISGLSDSLYVIFLCLSLLFFLSDTEQRKISTKALFFFFLSLLSKELALVGMGIIILYEMVVRKKWERQTIYTIGGYILIGLIYLSLRFTILQFVDMKQFWSGSLYGDHLTVRLATFFHSFFIFLGLLVYPKTLFIERDASIVVVNSLLSPWTVGFFLFIISISLFFWKLIQAKKTKETLLFLWFCFLASLLPYAGFFLLNGIFYEHYLYFPIVWFFACIMLVVFTENHKKITIGVITVILLLFFLRSLVRQYEWIDNVRLYRQTLVHAPKSVRVLNNLGMELAQRQENNEAIEIYKKAISLDPSIPNMYHNMANSYVALGKYTDAEKAYLQAIQVNPRFSYPYYFLLDLYLKTDQKQKAKDLLGKMLTLFPQDTQLKKIHESM